MFPFFDESHTQSVVNDRMIRSVNIAFIYVRYIVTRKLSPTGSIAALQNVFLRNLFPSKCLKQNTTPGTTKVTQTQVLLNDSIH